MKFFLDTASVAEIKEAAALGVLDGVTTNPSLVAKEKKDFRKLLEEICEIVDGPVSAEVVGTTTEEMLKEGRSLAKIAENIVVKVPLIKDGIKACKILREENIKVNVTLCFTPNQALMAAKAGATFISPFIGRLDDIGQDGMGIIRDIRQIYDNYSFPTEILVASVRHPVHVLEAAKVGADIVTVPFKVFDQLLAHPLTDLGLKKFLSDWKESQQKN